MSTSPAQTPVPPLAPRPAGRLPGAGKPSCLQGDLSTAPLRPVIADRWLRCREQGLDPFMKRAPTALSPEEVATILAREDLGRAGRSVLEEFGRVVEGTGHVIVLADEAGRILHAAGHSGIQHTLEEVNLTPGGLWSEAAVGPNGIGTPLALGRPEMVFGPEHYCRGWQPFFCCGSPVRDPATRRILGAVDITGPVGKAHPMAFALTLSIARWVERNLALLGFERRDVLLRAFRDIERRWPTESVLLVGGDGEIVDLNVSAANLLNLSSAAVPAPASLAELAPELWSAGREVLDLGGCRDEALVFRAPGGRLCSVKCRIEPIAVDGRSAGIVVVMSPRHAGLAAGRAPQAAPPARFPRARARTAEVRHRGPARGSRRHCLKR